ILAVEYTIERELHKDGSETLTRTMTVTEKVTYRQDWHSYNLAQATEKRQLQVLLADLCRGLTEPERDPSRRGPKPHPIRDQVFSMVFKVYCGLSARRFSTDLLAAHEKGYIGKPIPGAKVWKFLESQALTWVLTDLVAKSAAPLAVVEEKFAVDSTGFATTRFERWFDKKYGVTRQQCMWLKVHACCGVKTNVITA